MGTDRKRITRGFGYAGVNLDPVGSLTHGGKIIFYPYVRSRTNTRILLPTGVKRRVGVNCHLGERPATDKITAESAGPLCVRFVTVRTIRRHPGGIKSPQLPVDTGTMLNEGMILLISDEDPGYGKVPLGGREFLAAKWRNSAQGGANPKWLRCLASATVRKPVKTLEKTLS